MAANNSSSSTEYCLCIALMKSVILQASINNGPSSDGNMAATTNGPNPFRDFNKTIVIQSSTAGDSTSHYLALLSSTELY